MSTLPVFSGVLASTDFSEVANQAIPHAYAAVDDGGTVHLLHVLELAPPGTTPNPLYAHYTPTRTTSPEELERLRADCAERLRALVPTGLDPRRIRTEVHVVACPDVASAVTQTAERLGSSLICVGSHGRTGLMKVLLGSVAQRILAESPCPVLVIRATRLK